MTLTQEIEISSKALEGSKVYLIGAIDSFQSRQCGNRISVETSSSVYLPLGYLDLNGSPHRLAVIAAAHEQGSETNSIVKRVGS